MAALYRVAAVIKLIVSVCAESRSELSWWLAMQNDVAMAVGEVRQRKTAGTERMGRTRDDEHGHADAEAVQRPDQRDLLCRPGRSDGFGASDGPSPSHFQIRLHRAGRDAVDHDPTAQPERDPPEPFQRHPIVQRQLALVDERAPDQRGRVGRAKGRREDGVEEPGVGLPDAVPGGAEEPAPSVEHAEVDDSDDGKYKLAARSTRTLSVWERFR